MGGRGPEERQGPVRGAREEAIMIEAEHFGACRVTGRRSAEQRPSRATATSIFVSSCSRTVGSLWFRGLAEVGVPDLLDLEPFFENLPRPAHVPCSKSIMAVRVWGLGFRGSRVDDDDAAVWGGRGGDR
eukprot:2063538-Rhodomonas_salina.1